MRLSDEDYRSLEESYISREYADAAGLWRASSFEGRERVGRNGAGDYEGLVFPYVDPVKRHAVGERLRLYNPPVDPYGKPLHKYLSPPGQRNHFYWPLAAPAWLEDVSLPILITEGEKKYLAAHRASLEAGQDGRPLFFAIAVAGVYGWKGIIGATNNENGKRVPVKGVISDFDRVIWAGRRVVIAYDSNALTNDQVHHARGQLARDLAARGALVFLLDLPSKAPSGVAVNGVDDYLAAAGLRAFIDLYQQALRWNWREELVLTETGKVKANISKNAAIALRLAPEFREVLAYNLFAKRIEIRSATPWGSPPGPWRDLDDIRLREWLETHGILEGRATVADAVASVAQESAYHPVRDYLASLEWDSTPRLNSWLMKYAGAPEAELTRAIGAKWMISAIARVEQPGAKADHMLTLEGPQGAGKSTLLRILGGEFYTDDVPDLMTKDAQISVSGVWIVEFAELDAISRAEASRIKSFLSRTKDRYRAPYGRIMEEHPRQCVFAGTVNRSDYGNDETGLRRYWPIACGSIDLAGLERDRDQLWAEALERYRQGELWWFDDDRLTAEAEEQQAERQRGDAWDPIVASWLFSRLDPVSTAEVLTGALKKDIGQWSHADQTRVGSVLTRLGRKRKQVRVGGTRQWMYYPSEEGGA